MDMKGTQTEQNLRDALTGESLARNKYSFYAMAARAAGFDQIADNFERMAKNEMMHAKFWFERLYGRPDDVRKSLMNAMNGELQEATSMYPAFAKQARADGLEELAAMFESVARIEQDHARQFMNMLRELDLAEGKGAGREKTEEKPESGYRCMFCGATYQERPDVCDVCQAIGSFEAF